MNYKCITGQVLEIVKDFSRTSFNLSKAVDKFSKLASESDNYTACFKYSTLSSSADESST